MGGIMDFSVPSLPPGINHYYKTTRFGGRYVCKEGVAFKKLVMQHVHFKRVGAGKRDVKYQLVLKFSSPNWMTKKGSIHKRAGDIDGFAKCSIDALCEAIYIDDSAIFELHMYKVSSKEESTHFVLSEVPS